MSNYLHFYYYQTTCHITVDGEKKLPKGDLDETFYPLLCGPIRVEATEESG